VAIVVPLSNRSTLLDDEQVSLQHLRHYLGQYDRFMIAPRSLTVHFPDFHVVRFPDRYFGSVRAHTRLMLTPKFYEAFADYEFMLTYHLDSLALSDALPEWCARGWDFIGAANRAFTLPCNGGFALRRIASFLAVLRSRRYGVDPEAYWRDLVARTPRIMRPVYASLRYAKRLHLFNNVRREIRLLLNDRAEPLEDEFFVRNGPKYHPAFSVAPVSEAVRFAFDESPRQAFERNGFRLPFGAHRWYKLDRTFWEPYLLTRRVTPVHS
jgi:hypothetical protein